MIKVGDRVLIHPAHSLRFGNKIGVVVAIEGDGLPIKVKIGNYVYGFDYNELLKT